jgi:hypothetical protein
VSWTRSWAVSLVVALAALSACGSDGRPSGFDTEGMDEEMVEVVKNARPCAEAFADGVAPPTVVDELTACLDDEGEVELVIVVETSIGDNDECTAFYTVHGWWLEEGRVHAGPLEQRAPAEAECGSVG